MQSKSEFTEAQCARLLRRLTSRINTLRNLLQVAPSYIKSPAIGTHRHGFSAKKSDELDYRPGIGRRRNPTPEDDNETEDAFQKIQPRSRARVQYSKNARRNKATRAGQAEGQKSIITEPIPREFYYGVGSVHETMEKCLKPLMHKEVYAAVKAIILQVDDIVVETKREVLNRPQTLSEIIAAKIGRYAGTCETQDEADDLNKEVISFGQASYLKSMLRGQALGMFQKTLDEDLFRECAAGNRVIVEVRIVGTMVKALLERSAFTEAVELVESMIKRESTVEAARPLFELVSNCFASVRMHQIENSFPNPSSPDNLTLTSLRYRLSTFLLSSSHSRLFLASNALRDILEEGLLSYARYEAALHPQFFAEVYEFTTTYLLKAFGLGPRQIQLRHSENFLRKKHRNRKNSSRKPARKTSTNENSKALSYYQVEKAEKTLMLVVMALAGGCLYTSSATEGIYEKLFSNGYFRQDCPSAKPLVSRLANLFINQRLSEVRESERLWGGKVSYPTEAKSLVLFRYMFDNQEGCTTTESPDCNRIMERIYESISNNDAVNRMESAQHIVKCFVGSSQLFSEITVHDIVNLILRYINGGQSNFADPIAFPQTPARRSPLTDDRYTVLATFAVNMALHYVEVETDPGKVERLIVWAENVQKQVMRLGLYTPSKPKKSKDVGVSWKRPQPELSAKTRRHGYRYIDGIGEWVAIGCTPGRTAHELAAHLNGSPSSGTRRQKRPVNYEEPDLTPSSEIVFSDGDVEMEDGSAVESRYPGKGAVSNSEDEGIYDEDFYLQRIVSEADLEDEAGEEEEAEKYAADDSAEGEAEDEQATDTEDAEDSTANSVVMSPLFETAEADEFSRTNSDLTDDDEASSYELAKDSQSSTASRQFLSAVVISKRGPFSDFVSRSGRVDYDGGTGEVFSPRRRRPNNSIKIVIPESPSKPRTTPRLRKRLSLPTKLPSNKPPFAYEDGSEDELLTAPAIPAPLPKKRRASEIFDNTSETDEHRDNDDDDEYIEGRTGRRCTSSNRSKPRKRRSVTPATSETTDHNPGYRLSKRQIEVAPGKRLLRRSFGHTVSSRRSSNANYSLSVRTRSGHSSGKLVLDFSEDELSFY